MTPLFLDSSFVIALHSRSDQNHKAAVARWNSLRNRNVMLVTTSHVFTEVVTFLNSREAHSVAVRVGREMLSSRSIDLVFVTWDLLMAGWEYFVRHQDKRYSLTDCISFLVMEERSITESLTFDAHFTQAGFRIIP